MPQVAIRPIPKRTLSLVICLIASVILSALAATPARAQAPAPPPAYIAAVEGSATLEREGEATPAVVNMPLLPGDRVLTSAGRVEIRFPDGTGIEVAEFSVVELVTDTRVRLLAGSIDRLEPLQANVGATSASYLPQDLQMFGGTFDQYGTWGYAPSYGYVWYPTVAAGWRPYHYGYWEPMRRYGWTWIGADAWAWPTHHYGRWGYAGNAWFWVPGPAFAGAWVSWGSAPGYVSWCPLGFDNRPVFALSVGFGNAYSGWTVVPSTHFGSRGYYAHRYAVDPGHLPRHTTFVAQSAPAVAVPRHVTNGAPAGGGLAGANVQRGAPGVNVQGGANVAVPRGDRAVRAGAAEGRPSPVTVSPAIQPTPAIVIPPAVSSGQPVRAGAQPSYGRPPQPQTSQPQASQPQAAQPRQSQPQQQQQQPPPPPPPQQATPRAVPRQSTGSQPAAPQPAAQQPAAQQPAPQQNSNGGGQGGGHQRAGTTAPRGDAGSQPNGGAARRR